MLKRISIIPISQIGEKTNSGTKARNLATLQKIGLTLPTTYVIPFEAFENYLIDKKSTLETISKLLKIIIDEKKQYSIRSSANTEDSSNISFAGQFETHLNCKKIDPIKNAIESTWISAKGQMPNTYKSNLGVGSIAIKMAVIIQEMVHPKFSGVVFTKNPLIGLDEVIVETVEGYCDSLVQKGLTPDRWIYKWGQWINYPEDKKNRTEIILEIVHTALEIEKKVGCPIDLEWAYDGNQIFWLQMRKITTLTNTTLYSNRISRELLPGIILPLVWSINIPVVNSSWKRIFKELIGSSAEQINVNKLAKQFYYRAYFNMTVVGNVFQILGMPRESLEILAGIPTPHQRKLSFKPGAQTIRYLPRILCFTVTKLFFCKNIEFFLRKRKKQYEKIATIDFGSLDESSCLEVIETLLELNMDSSYYVIISQLLNSLYTKILKSQLEKKHIPFEKVDFKEANQRLKPIDPKQQIAILRENFQSLNLEQQFLIKKLSWKKVMKSEKIGPFKESLCFFINRFGHLSDSGNDFSKPTWKEKPDIILKMIVNQKSPPRTDNKKNKTQFVTGFRNNMLLSLIYKRACKYKEYRESVNFLYTFGYGLFRNCFLRLGSLLSKKGILEQKNDIFFLSYNELKKLITDPSQKPKLNSKIIERKAEIARFKDISLPELIFNELPESALTTGKTICNLKGVATSRGYYVGPAILVRGPGEFDKIRTGDVLVIPFSDVSWTPLFSKVSAVVSESGGILSHCS
ncbi:MAG: hypothetical protein JW702_04505, partial [Clostridiales bacterium]|nr:hypothetical protein [Clostridiales bacterium]